MNATLLYRIASVLLVLFAVGHTIGFLKFTPPTPEGVAVRDAMNNVHFQVRGSTYSYGGFYNGFGLAITFYVFFLAFLAWHLGDLAGADPRAIGALGWIFFILHVAMLGVAKMYFAPLVAVFSGVIAACLGWAAWLVKRAAAAGAH